MQQNGEVEVQVHVHLQTVSTCKRYLYFVNLNFQTSKNYFLHLEVLKELSNKIQLIFFNHLDLSMSLVPEEVTGVVLLHFYMQQV